jgi:hypothetical protein
MFRVAAAWIVALLALLGVFGCKGWGEGGGTPIEAGVARTEASEAGLRIERGREWYTEYCVACHGVGGRGDGSPSVELQRQPADLTRIAQRSNGAFDAPSVAAFIDGRYRVSGDGPRDMPVSGDGPRDMPVSGDRPRDMPVWGRRFDDRNESLLRDETRLAPGAILLIVEYLASIQVQPESDSRR